MHGGKIIALEVLRKYQGDNEELREKLNKNYDCKLNDINNPDTIHGNYDGSAPAMETTGLRRGLHYLKGQKVYCTVMTKDGDVALEPTLKW